MMGTSHEDAAWFALRYTPEQVEFLRFIKQTEERRFDWRKEGASLREASLPFSYDLEADALRGRKLVGGRLAPKGSPRSQASIGIEQLRDLEDCWDEPLVSLNARGESVLKRWKEPMVTQSVRITTSEWLLIKEIAKQRGFTASDLIRRGLLREIYESSASQPR